MPSAASPAPDDDEDQEELTPMPVTVTMPQLGETVTEGTILSWAKRPGDTIAEDEVLLEISTDKVDTEVPSPAAGILQEILVAEGETVHVGTPLAVIATAGEEPTAVPTPQADAIPEPEPVAAVPALEPTAPIAEMGPTGGGPIEPPPARRVQVAEVPAAAVAAAVPQPAGDGSRRSILSPVVRKLASEHGVDLSLVAGSGEGGRITRRDVEAHIATVGGAAAAVAVEPLPEPEPVVEAQAPTKVTLEPAAPPVPAPAPPPAAEPTRPVPTVVAGVGPGDQVIELGRLRRRIAENMINAKRTAAHVWTSVEVDYERVEQVRRRHKEQWKAAEGYSLTYLPFIARATMDALTAHPVVNSSFLLEEGRQIVHGSVNLGIAVDLDQDGLVVVTIRGAEGLTLKGLARAIRALAAKAREGQLEPNDISGSSFSITNPGPFGSFMSAPIINVPNVAILSTETVSKRATVVTLPDGTDTIAIRHIGYLGLTWDHRAFDGSTAVLFLQRIKQNLESWDWDQELA